MGHPQIGCLRLNAQKLPNKGSPGPSLLTRGQWPDCSDVWLILSTLLGESQVIVAVSGFAVGGDALASAKVDSNVLIGLQGCKDEHLWHLVNRLGINRKSGGKFLGDSWKYGRSNSNGWSGRCDA